MSISIPELLTLETNIFLNEVVVGVGVTVSVGVGVFVAVSVGVGVFVAVSVGV
jgi:hypothetical protein